MRILIIGAAGRMGLALARAARELADTRIAGAVTSEGSPLLGHDIGELAGIGSIGVPLVSDLPASLTECDVALDFSRTAATASNLAACTAAGKPLLIGTSGLAASLQSEFERAARHIALLVAPNTSLGITLLLELVQQCASVLPLDFDVEISEAHHRHKVDAPSGTALALGLAIAGARGQKFEEVGVSARRSGTPRREGEIGFAVVRAGDLVGEHRVLFAGAGEQLELTHRATDRSVFARSALKAARWLVGRSPGHYSMRDIIFRNK